MLHRLANLGDALTLDQNFARTQNPAIFNLEQARGVEHDCMR
jgi:hypothetical protein